MPFFLFGIVSGDGFSFVERKDAGERGGGVRLRKEIEAGFGMS